MGTSNAYLSRYEIEKFLYERDNPAYRFDKSTVKEYKDKIDNKTLQWFIKKAKEERNINVYTKSSSEDTLKNLGAYTDKKLNIAGILTFGKNIQQALSNALVKCAVFAGKDKTGRILDYLNIKENVFTSIERQIKNLREKGIIKRRGSRKTGGYFIK